MYWDFLETSKKFQINSYKINTKIIKNLQKIRKTRNLTAYKEANERFASYSP